MITRRSLLLLALMSVVTCVYAQMDIELQSLVALKEGTFAHNRAKRSQHIENGNSVVVIAKVEKGENLRKEALEEIGVKVRSDYGRVAVLSVPISKLKTVAEMDEIEYLSTDHKRKLMNDVARSETQVNLLQSTVNGQRSTDDGQQSTEDVIYDGTGVLVGVLDVGIDFNHAAFRDENGNTRIKMAQIYDLDAGGPEPEDASEYCRTYTLPEEIALLESDSTMSSHGSHTSATAAGSPVVVDVSPFSSPKTITGMAPKAELLLTCFSSKEGHLYDSYIMAAMKSQMEYAEKVGKPIVINNSFGGVSVFCDGKDTFSAFQESLTGPGRILCYSAGNENAKLRCLEYTPESDDEVVKVILFDDHGSNYEYGSEAYVVSEDETPIDVKLKIVDTSQPGSMRELNRWKYYSYADSAYIQPEDILFGGNEPAHDNRYMMQVKMPPGYATSKGESYQIALHITGQKGKKFRVVYPSGSLPNWDDNRYKKGTGANAVNSICESDSVISVGAYVSREEGVLWDKRRLNSGAKLHQPSSFSSYGRLTTGKRIPDVLAPGEWVLSAFNANDTQMILNGEMMGNTCGYSSLFGRKSYYGWMSGTSMSCPMATGIIALWLQANPNLSVSDVRDVLRNSSEYYPESADYPEEALGYGYLKAKNGVEYILAKETGVASLSTVNSQRSTDIYNLAGQRVDEGYKGMVIRDGKKYLVK